MLVLGHRIPNYIVVLFGGKTQQRKNLCRPAVFEADTLHETSDSIV